MAITATALSADLSATGLTMKVASGTGFPTAGGPPSAPGYMVRVNREKMLAVSQPVAGVIKLAMRGYDGTFAQAHDILSPVEVSALGSDFANPFPGNTVALPPYTPGMHTIGETPRVITADEVAAWGNQAQVFQLIYAGATAVSLAAPSQAQDGLLVTFTSLVAQAHVITATGLLGDGASGSPEDLATFDAYIGATVVLMAQNGIWNVQSLVGVVIS